MDVQNRTIAVTGASGMLGAYLCKALLREGARVVGVVRNPDKARFLEAEGVEFRRADLMEREALTTAFRGCDAVISNAALYSVLNQRWKDNYNANKVGTENVYEAVAAAEVPRVIHISTMGVYRFRLGLPATDESSPVIDGERKQGGAYRATKQLSEALAFSISKKYGIATTALRPAGIYGARDHNAMPYFRAMMRLPIVPVPTFRFPFVHADDLARAAIGALRNEDSAGKPYLTAGRHDTLLDFFRGWKEASGKRNWLLPIPVPTGVLVDCSQAERDLGFNNRSYADGLSECFEADARYRSDRQLVGSAPALPAD